MSPLFRSGDEIHPLRGGHHHHRARLTVEAMNAALPIMPKASPP